MRKDMEGKYTFKEFYENLENGYQIYYTYVRNRYLIFKTAENCYTQKLLSKAEKNPQGGRERSVCRTAGEL